MSSNNERLRRNPPRGAASANSSSSSAAADVSPPSSRPVRQTRQTTNGRKAPIIIDSDEDDDDEPKEIKPKGSGMSRSNKPAAQTSDVNFDDVEKLESITGLSRTESIELLKACNGNLETAINIHLGNQESKKPAKASTAATSGKGALKRTHEDVYQSDESSSSAAATSADDDIRAPIPQKSEKLIDYDPYAVFRNQSKRPKSVFDGFRNIQEECKDTETSPSKRKAKSNLAQIFRPPVDLMFSGSLEAAKSYGCKENKWILLNVQKTDSFECHCLNRDLWRDGTVKEIVRASFVFLLIYEETSEGVKLMSYYNIRSFPFIAVLNPRTGEKVAHFNKKYDTNSFLEAVTTFLSDHELPVDDTLEESAIEETDKPAVEKPVVNGFNHRPTELVGASVSGLQSNGGKVDLSMNGYYNSINNSQRLTNGTAPKGKSAASVLAELTGEPCEEVDVENDAESSNDSDQKIYRNSRSKARLQSSEEEEEEEVVVRKDKYDLMKKSSSSSSSTTSSKKLEDKVKQISIDNKPKPSGPPQIIKHETEEAGVKDCFLRILFPNGDRLDFATNGDSNLKVLVDYLAKLGFKKSNHELIERLMPQYQAKEVIQKDSQVTHQSRNLFSLDPNKSTFKDAGLYPRTFLLLQEI